MRVQRRAVERRSVIEAYVAYDCSKKGLLMTDLTTWDWSRADTLDLHLANANLKSGVLSGFRSWELVEVTVVDLRECAVLDRMFPGQPRALGDIEDAGGLRGWKPDRLTSWYDDVLRGKTFDEYAPLILRPAVRCEADAKWYVEDGSGRAVAMLSNRGAFKPTQILAVGYLGREPDPDSSFMKNSFRELLA